MDPRAHELGLPFSLGLGARYGGQAWRMEFMVQAGIPPMDVIRSATSVAAKLIGYGDRVGTVERGKLADLVAVEENPLQDMRSMRQIHFVMKDGVVGSERPVRPRAPVTRIIRESRRPVVRRRTTLADQMTRRTFVSTVSAGLAGAGARPAYGQTPSVLTRHTVKPRVIADLSGAIFRNGGTQKCVETAFSMIL